MNKFALLLLSFLLLSCSKEDKLITSLKDKMGTSEINQMIDTMSNSTLDGLMSHIKSDSKADTILYMFIDSVLHNRERIAEAKKYVERHSKESTRDRIRKLTVRDIREVKEGIENNLELRKYLDSVLARHADASERDTIGDEILKDNRNNLVGAIEKADSEQLAIYRKMLEK